MKQIHKFIKHSKDFERRPETYTRLQNVTIKKQGMNNSVPMKHGGQKAAAAEAMKARLLMVP